VGEREFCVLPSAAGERTKVRGPRRFMGSLDAIFSAHWNHEPLRARGLAFQGDTGILPVRGEARSNRLEACFPLQPSRQQSECGGSTRFMERGVVAPHCKITAKACGYRCWSEAMRTTCRDQETFL